MNAYSAPTNSYLPFHIMYGNHDSLYYPDGASVAYVNNNTVNNNHHNDNGSIDGYGDVISTDVADHPQLLWALLLVKVV